MTDSSLEKFKFVHNAGKLDQTVGEGEKGVKRRLNKSLSTTWLISITNALSLCRTVKQWHV